MNHKRKFVLFSPHTAELFASFLAEHLLIVKEIKIVMEEGKFNCIALPRVYLCSFWYRKCFFRLFQEAKTKSKGSLMKFGNLIKLKMENASHYFSCETWFSPVLCSLFPLKYSSQSRVWVKFYVHTNVNLHSIMKVKYIKRMNGSFPASLHRFQLFRKNSSEKREKFFNQWRSPFHQKRYSFSSGRHSNSSKYNFYVRLLTFICNKRKRKKIWKTKTCWILKINFSAESEDFYTFQMMSFMLSEDSHAQIGGGQVACWKPENC